MHLGLSNNRRLKNSDSTLTYNGKSCITFAIKSLQSLLNQYINLVFNFPMKM